MVGVPVTWDGVAELNFRHTVHGRCRPRLVGRLVRNAE